MKRYSHMVNLAALFSKAVSSLYEKIAPFSLLKKELLENYWEV